jgi:site-specific DNA-methyltransferase (adenine-specific)
MWIYGSGFPKSHNIGKAIDKIQGNEREVIGDYETSIPQITPWQDVDRFESKNQQTKGNGEWEGWGTALKPAHEPICMARKPLSEKSIAENVLKHGTGGINIDDCRIGITSQKDLEDYRFNMDGNLRTNKNEGDKLGMYDGGWKIDKEQKELPEGRFPANIIFDEEAGKILDEQSDKASRFFYCPKVSKKERGDGNVHPTVKPIKLMEYLIKLVTPKGGVVLEPFMGSGSTGIAAKNLGMSFIGIEREEEYFEIAKQRINGN